jgi:uncharacterized protein (DUF2237 family)
MIISGVRTQRKRVLVLEGWNGGHESCWFKLSRTQSSETNRPLRDDCRFLAGKFLLINEWDRYNQRIDMDEDEVFDGGPTRQRNVLGGPLRECSGSPKTGFFRNGRCDTCPEDLGAHVVCAEVTEEFLAFSAAAGNDLSTPRPEFGFPGLQPGDRWCLCAARWKQAFDAGVAPPVILNATHESALAIVPIEDLRQHSTA